MYLYFRRIERLLKAPEARPVLWALLCAFLFCSPYLFSGMLRAQFQANYPEFAASWPVDGSFSLIGLSAGETQAEELFYASRVQEASEKLLPFDPYILENRSPRMLLVDHISYRFMGLVHLLTGEMTATWILTRFLCCAFWFILIFHLALRTTGSEPAALFCAAFVTCFSYLLTLLFFYALEWSWNPVKLLLKNAWVILSYGRTESVYRLPRPGVTYAALYLAALLNIRAADGRGIRPVVAAGIVGGLLSYVRLDVATTYLGATFIFAAVSSWRKGAWDKRLWLAAGLTALVSLPFYAVNIPADKELLIKATFGFGRYFDPWSLVYLAAFLAALRFDRKPAPLFFASLLASVFLIRNSQLVTGVYMSWEHWSFIANIFMFLFLVSHAPKRWFKRERWLRGGALAMLLAAFLQGMVYAALHFPFQGLPKNYELALQWLDRRAAEDSVVLSLDPEISLLVAAYTHSKVGIGHGAPQVSDFPLHEAARRLQRALKLYGADQRLFYKECVLPEPHHARRDIETRRQKHEMWVNNIFFHGIRPEELIRIWGEAEGTQLTRPFRIDYIWYGHFERKFAPRFPARAARDPLIEEVYRNDSLRIYRRVPPRS